MAIAFTAQRSRKMPATQAVGILLGFLFLGTALVAAVGLLTSDDKPDTTFQIIVALFSVYLYVECSFFLKRADTFSLFSPVLLATVGHFYLVYIMPSAATIFDPWILHRFSPFFSSREQELITAVAVIWLAAFCMWRGYQFGRKPGLRFKAKVMAMPALRRQLEPALVPVIAVQLVFFGLIAYAVSLGVFGMASSAAARDANLDVVDLINTGIAGGALSLLLLLMDFFRRKQQGQAAFVMGCFCAGVIAIHLVIASISGFKFQLVMPFVMLAMAKFLVEGRISMTYIVSGALALLVAYMVIEPYRAYLQRNTIAGGSSVGDLVEAFQKAQEQKDMMIENDLTLTAQIVSRFDLTGMSAVGISFVNRGGDVSLKSAELAESIYLAPVLAYVPRGIWPDKPIYSTGIWFSQTVLGNIRDDRTSIGMGPVTWLYIMGGAAGVAFGFFAFGWLQALMFEGVARSGSGGLIIYLSAAATLVMIPTDFGPALTGMLRLLPIAFFAQLILLKPDRVRVP